MIHEKCGTYHAASCSNRRRLMCLVQDGWLSFVGGAFFMQPVALSLGITECELLRHYNVFLKLADYMNINYKVKH